ncbi:C45 family autoproteolytic acyltransferase/hydolase [Acrocarpospora macrocephala]|uniref:Peptidase C45 n=1 Tax=Acrocarpospora macrocephala TaxID=150177 RepID=A0A5M3X2E4_9ACTN|nr:C45 family peptidase [Acrocarpospora macrocephala]GES13761.1 peptidase C45 [Acrocarpospora macrocephala]
MIRAYTSTDSDPFERGHEFGQVHAVQVAHTVDVYRDMFQHHGGSRIDLVDLGTQALKAIAAWAPDLADEITGIAEGARLPVTDIAAINARTEILAMLDGRPRSECSAVVLLGDDPDSPPVAVQTWDWTRDMAEGWLVWTIEHENRTVHTLTEYGVVGKIGVNSLGLGLLFTRLHHEDDGQEGIGLPVHVAARRALDECDSVTSAAYLLASADVSASSSLNLVSYGAEGKAAITAELHPGGPGWSTPEDDGMLVHTNHFLDPRVVPYDPFPSKHPGTLIRRDLLRRGLRGQTARPSADQVKEVMSRHAGGVCHHRAPGADDDHITLATVELDLPNGELLAMEGGPCGDLTW